MTTNPRSVASVAAIGLAIFAGVFVIYETSFGQPSPNLIYVQPGEPRALPLEMLRQRPGVW